MVEPLVEPLGLEGNFHPRHQGSEVCGHREASFLFLPSFTRLVKSYRNGLLFRLARFHFSFYVAAYCVLAFSFFERHLLSFSQWPWLVLTL